MIKLIIGLIMLRSDFCDFDGQHYHQGRGLTLLIDGRRAANRPDLGLLKAELPATAKDE